MKYKKSGNKLLIISIISMSAIFTLASCTSASIDKIDVDTGKTQEEEIITEEEIKELEEVVEAVDYENALIGAEIKGYIPSFLCTDTDNYIKIEITNTSDFTWRSGGKNRVRIGYHYYGQDVDYTDYDKTTRTPLPDNIEPGESVTIEVLINDITHKGTYVLQIDPVLEGYFWFSGKGVPMLEGKTYFSSCMD